jgi:hypothetical protein
MLNVSSYVSEVSSRTNITEAGTSMASITEKAHVESTSVMLVTCETSATEADGFEGAGIVLNVNISTASGIEVNINRAIIIEAVEARVAFRVSQ